MKNKSKTTSPTKIRKGILTNWELSPQFNYQQQQQIFHLIRFWITSLNEIPLNYLIQKYLRFIWKIQKNHFYYHKKIYNFNRPFISKSRKFWPFHFYRRVGSLTSLGFEQFFDDNCKWRGVSWEEWERKIKKLTPLQYFLREKFLEQFDNWTHVF